MNLAIFSSPEYLEGEEQLVNLLFKEGLEFFHLRKPGWDLKQMEEYLKHISPAHYRKIIIHSGYSLIKKYNLKGIYINGDILRKDGSDDIKMIMNAARKRGLWVITSAHSLEEISLLGKGYNYILLSPIFDSISKLGYKSRFDLKQLNMYLTGRSHGAVPIWALGGVSSGNLSLVLENGFKGAAVLGAIWEPFVKAGKKSALGEFRKLKALWDK